MGVFLAIFRFSYFARPYSWPEEYVTVKGPLRSIINEIFIKASSPSKILAAWKKCVASPPKMHKFCHVQQVQQKCILVAQLLWDSLLARRLPNYRTWVHDHQQAHDHEYIPSPSIVLEKLLDRSARLSVIIISRKKKVPRFSILNAY